MVDGVDGFAGCLLGEWLWRLAAVDRVECRRVLETTVSGTSAVMVMVAAR
ncbi:hypothetical protein [Streptomyces sp. NPDC091371]